MRSLALGSELTTRGLQVVWLTSSADEFLMQRARSAKIEVFVDTALHADSTDVDAAARLAPDLVVVDGYHLGGPYLERLSALVIPFMVIDDLGINEPTGAALVVNPNPQAVDALYPHVDRSRLLLGSQYALIRQEVRNARLSPRRREVGARPLVLVAVGGTDVLSLNQPVASGLARSGCCHVVTTAPCEDSGVRQAPADIAEALAGATVAVIGGGGTMSEACFLGIPSLALVVADNQLPGATAMEAAGAVAWMDARRGIEVDEVIAFVAALLRDPDRRHSMCTAGRRVVDGRGVDRVADAVEWVLSS